MSLDKILTALREEAERQIAAIERDTQAELAAIQARAEAEAEAEREAQRQAVLAPLPAERARILNRARQEALQVILGAREGLIAAALAETAHQLALLADSRDYPALLQQLIQEAAEALGGDGPLRLRVRSRDVALAEQCAAELGLSADVEDGLEDEPSPWGCLGGVVATTADGRISLVNTLAARLERAASLHRARIAEMLFGPPHGR